MSPVGTVPWTYVGRRESRLGYVIVEGGLGNMSSGVFLFQSRSNQFMDVGSRGMATHVCFFGLGDGEGGSRETFCLETMVRVRGLVRTGRLNSSQVDSCLRGLAWALLPRVAGVPLFTGLAPFTGVPRDPLSLLTATVAICVLKSCSSSSKTVPKRVSRRIEWVAREVTATESTVAVVPGALRGEATRRIPRASEVVSRPRN